MTLSQFFFRLLIVFAPAIPIVILSVLLKIGASGKVCVFSGDEEMGGIIGFSILGITICPLCAALGWVFFHPYFGIAIMAFWWGGNFLGMIGYTLEANNGWWSNTLVALIIKVPLMFLFISFYLADKMMDSNLMPRFQQRPIKPLIGKSKDVN